MRIKQCLALGKIMYVLVVIIITTALSSGYAVNKENQIKTIVKIKISANICTFFALT